MKAKGPKQFWQVADDFRARDGSWSPANAGYERHRIVKVNGKRWSLCLKVHVILESPRGTGARFRSSVTIWPPKLSESEQHALTSTGWYLNNSKLLARRGYTGEWMKDRHGVWGDFWKELVDVPGVRAEAILLESFELLEVSGPPLVRTRQRAR